MQLILNTTELETIREIVKTKERVVYLYNRYQQTIQSDDSLIEYYKDIFGSIEKTDGITRAGRKLRQPHNDGEKQLGTSDDWCTCFNGSKKCFKRNEEVQEQCNTKENTYRRWYGEN